MFEVGTCNSGLVRSAFPTLGAGVRSRAAVRGLMGQEGSLDLPGWEVVGLSLFPYIGVLTALMYNSY